MATALRDVQRRNNAGRGEEEFLPPAACRRCWTQLVLGGEGGTGRLWPGMTRSFGERGLKKIHRVKLVMSPPPPPPPRRSEAKEDLEALLHGIYTLFFSDRKFQHCDQ